MAAKRPIVVEGNTPGKPTNKRQVEGKSRRSLFSNETETTANINNASFAKKPENWSREETSTLVQYICLYWKDAWSDKWPMAKDKDFWDSCALTVNRVCQSAKTSFYKL